MEPSEGNVVIRPAVESDAAVLRGLRLEALADTPQAFGADYDATAAESDEDWAGRIRLHQGSQGRLCVAAVENGLVGMLGILRGNRPKTRLGASIWGVYVTPAWRGRRLTDAMIEMALEWAWAQGIRIVKLGVITSNIPAIRCYARCGFQVYGVEPQAIFYNDVFYDELLMAKTIDS